MKGYSGGSKTISSWSDNSFRFREEKGDYCVGRAKRKGLINVQGETPYGQGNKGSSSLKWIKERNLKARRYGRGMREKRGVQGSSRNEKSRERESVEKKRTLR